VRAIVVLLALTATAAAAPPSLSGTWERNAQRFKPHSSATCGDGDGNMIDGREGWSRMTRLVAETDGSYVLETRHAVWHGCSSTQTRAEERGTWSVAGGVLRLEPAELVEHDDKGGRKVQTKLAARRHPIRFGRDKESETLVVRGACPAFLRGDTACGALVFHRRTE
jgi:hypothetical protein